MGRFFYYEVANKSGGIAQEGVQDQMELNRISVCTHQIL